MGDIGSEAEAVTVGDSDVPGDLQTSFECRVIAWRSRAVIDEVDEDPLRASCFGLLDQATLDCTIPRPLSDLAQAAVIDSDEDDIPAGGLRGKIVARGAPHVFGNRGETDRPANKRDKRGPQQQPPGPLLADLLRGGLRAHDLALTEKG